MALSYVTVKKFCEQVSTLEEIQFTLTAPDNSPLSAKLRVAAYDFSRKLAGNAGLRQLMTRVRVTLANGDAAEAQNLKGNEAAIRGTIKVKVTLHKKMDAHLFKGSEITMAQIREESKAPVAEKTLSGFQKIATDHVQAMGAIYELIHTDKRAHTMGAGEQMDAMRGMLAQFIHTPRSGQRKADCLPTEPVAALEFLLKHYLATGAGTLARDNNPPKEVVKGIDKLYAGAFPNGDPEHMDDHIPEDYLLLFWNINKYRFGVGHPITVYNLPKPVPKPTPNPKKS